MKNSQPIYSIADVRKMIADGNLNLADLPSRRLSLSQVIVEVVNSSGIKVLTSPTGYQIPGIIETILHSFTLPTYAIRIGPSEKATRNLAVESFFSFLEKKSSLFRTQVNHSSTTDFFISIPRYAFQDWFNFLKETDSDYNVWLKTSYVLKILNGALKAVYGNPRTWPNDQKEFLLSLKALTPKKPEHKKSPPLGLYLGIPETRFNNKELLMGIRYGAIWLLQKLKSIRAEIANDSVIREILYSCHGHHLKEAKTKLFLDSKAHSSGLTAAWKCIRDCPLLTEWQCYSFNKLQHFLEIDSEGVLNPLSAAEQRSILENCLHSDGSLRSHFRRYRNDDPKLHRLSRALIVLNGATIIEPCFFRLDWLRHTALEQLLMVWLLASERAQLSGIEKLNFEGIHISDGHRSTLQISTKKLRRSKHFNDKPSATDVESAIYKHNEPPYKIYKSWLEHEQHLHQFLEGYNPNRRFVYGLDYPRTGLIAQRGRRSFPDSMLPLQLLATENSVWQNSFLNDTALSGQREAHAFIAILQNRVELKQKKPGNRVDLPTGPIGQSLVVQQTARSSPRSMLAKVESEVMGHTETTGRDVYKQGFLELSVSEIIEPVQSFARRVGDEKFLLAQSLAERLKSNCRKIDLQELEKICGLESALTDQQQMLDHLDQRDKLLISGEINHCGKMLIVETDLIASMIWSFMNHLVVSLKTILNSDRQETIIRHLARIIYLHNIFEEFPKHLQVSGKNLARTIDFKFPSIT